MKKIKLLLLIILVGGIFSLVKPKIVLAQLACYECGYSCGPEDIPTCNKASSLCWSKYCGTCATGYICDKVSTCSGCTEIACASGYCGTIVIGCYAPTCTKTCSCGCTVSCSGGTCNSCTTPSPSPSPSTTVVSQCGSLCPYCPATNLDGKCCQLAPTTWECENLACYYKDSSGYYCYDTGTCGTGGCNSNQKPYICDQYTSSCEPITLPAPIPGCYVDTSCPQASAGCIATYLKPWGGEYCSGIYAGYYLCEDNCGGIDCKTYACGSDPSPSSLPLSSPSSCDPLDYIPGPPSLTPADGGSAATDGGGEVTTSWSIPVDTSFFEYEVYPAGSDCDSGFCDSLGTLNYTFSPIASTYYNRVRSCNVECGINCGSWTEATFDITSGISGQVKVDNSGLALPTPSGSCVLAGASGVQPDAESAVSVSGGYSVSVDGSGNYSLTVPTGGGYTAGLVIGDLTQYTCTCPVGCTYGGISSPMSNLDFFVSNMKSAWWQVDSGNVHADSGNVLSSIPSTADDPYLITGESGLVSYGVAVNLGEGTINESGDVWQAQTSYQGLVTGYAYFDRILQDDPQDFYVFNGGEPGEGNGVYASGDISTSGSWSVASGEVYVVLVDGNVTITENINVDPGGFLAIIASGNIGIADSVTNVEGVYVADGLIDSGLGDSQLLAEGIFTGWTGFTLGRDFGTMENNTTPVEKFIYRPDLVSNAYSFLLKPRMTWTEVSP